VEPAIPAPPGRASANPENQDPLRGAAKPSLAVPTGPAVNDPGLNVCISCRSQYDTAAGVTARISGAQLRISGKRLTLGKLYGAQKQMPC